MRKRFLVPNRSIPTDTKSETDLVNRLQAAGLLDGVIDEMRRRPGGRIEVSAGFRGMYFHVEYPDDPKGASLSGFVMLSVYNFAVFSFIGWLLAWPDLWLFKGDPRHELLAIRGACFGGIGLLWVFVANRFDRAFTIGQVVVCVAVMMALPGLPLFLLVSKADWSGILWLLGLAYLYRDEWNDWCED